MADRIYKVLEFRSENEKKKGLCYEFIKPTRFCIGSCWVLRCSNNSLIDTRYIVCRDHIERIVDNAILTVPQENYTNEQCLNSDSENYLEQYRIQKKPSCFYFFMEDIIVLSEFCFECKYNFASSSEFNLKLVKIYRDSVNGGRWALIMKMITLILFDFYMKKNLFLFLLIQHLHF